LTPVLASTWTKRQAAPYLQVPERVRRRIEDGSADRTHIDPE
jgi:hypothetical protein